MCVCVCVCALPDHCVVHEMSESFRVQGEHPGGAREGPFEEPQKVPGSFRELRGASSDNGVARSDNEIFDFFSKLSEFPFFLFRFFKVF